MESAAIETETVMTNSVCTKVLTHTVSVNLQTVMLRKDAGTQATCETKTVATETIREEKNVATQVGYKESLEVRPPPGVWSYQRLAEFVCCLTEKLPYQLIKLFQGDANPPL